MTINTFGRIIFGLILILGISCTDEDKKLPYQQADQKLYGELKIKTLRIYSLKENSKDSVLYSVKDYDKNGSLTDEIIYQDDGSNKDVQKKIVYNQTNLETSILIKYFVNYFRPEQILVKQIILYDKNNFQNEIYIETNNDRQKISVICNKDGFPVKKITRDNQARILQEETYSYTKKNDLEKYMNSKNDGTENMYIYKYNSQHQNNEIFVYTNNQLSERMVYTYNSNNLMVSESSYDSNNHCDFTATYSFYPSGLIREKNADYPQLQNIPKAVNWVYYYEFYQD